MLSGVYLTSIVFAEFLQKHKSNHFLGDILFFDIFLHRGRVAKKLHWSEACSGRWNEVKKVLGIIVAPEIPDNSPEQ